MTIFCPKCGNAVKEGLKFCNSCGFRLVYERPSGGGNNGTLLIVLGAATLITIFGFGGLIGFIALLLKQGVKEELVAMAMMSWLFVMLVLDVMLIRKASKLIDNKVSGDNVGVDLPQAAQGKIPLLNRHSTAQLEEPKQPVGSVTDHTTRMLEKEPFDER